MAQVDYRLEYVSGSFPYVDDIITVMVTNCATTIQSVQVQGVDAFNQLGFEVDTKVAPGFTWAHNPSFMTGLGPPFRIVIRTTGDQMVPSIAFAPKDDPVNSTTRIWPDNFVVFPLFAPPVHPPVAPVQPSKPPAAGG